MLQYSLRYDDPEPFLIDWHCMQWLLRVVHTVCHYTAKLSAAPFPFELHDRACWLKPNVNNAACQTAGAEGRLICHEHWQNSAGAAQLSGLHYIT